MVKSDRDEKRIEKELNVLQDRLRRSYQAGLLEQVDDARRYYRKVES